MSSGYDPIVRAFGHVAIPEPTADCMLLGGGSRVYDEELKTSVEDASPRSLRWQRTMGWSFHPCRPQLGGLIDAAIAWATSMVEAQAVVVIAPRSAHGSRSLPMQKWIRVAWALQEEGVRTIAIDRDQDAVQHFPFYAYGYDWQHVLALLSLSAVVAANDSGIAHLSATIGRPTVVAMGPTIGTIIFGHSTDVVRQVTSEQIECRGCHFRFEKGYRVACDYGCEVLSMISWSRLKSEIRSALTM